MARRKNVKRIDPRYFLDETVNRGEGISSLVSAALEGAKLPSNTRLVGYGIAGDRITLIPEDPNLYAQNIDDIPGAHSQYIMIMPDDMEAAGVGLKGVVDELEAVGLQRQEIHTGDGWSGPAADLHEEQSIFAPNHYCVHHGGVQHEGQIKMAEAINHNYDRKLNRVTHYDMRLQDGTILESVPAEDIQVVRASLAEEHSHEGGCPSEEGDVASDISQLSPEEAFEAGMAAAREAIDQAMGGPDGPPPEGGFAAEPAMD